MSINQFLHTHVYRHVLKQYLKFTTYTSIGGFKIKVLRGVFHPKLFFSTPYLFDYLNSQVLTNASFLEIGSGSGILSLLAYKKGALVTAVDIDTNAVENTKINFALQFGQSHKATIYQSDLFQNIPAQKFDRILINPPYFFKDVQHPAQYAWYCGQSGEYFNNMFLGLSEYIHPETKINMILADNCDIERIKSIAKKHNFYFEMIQQKKIKWEINYIFRIYHIAG